MKTNDAGTPLSRRHLWAAAILTGAILLLLLCSIGVYSSIHNPVSEDETILREPPAASAAAAAPLYVLREFEQKIGIFEEGERTPFQILDVYVFTLPETDRTALQNGIQLYSDEELRARIEDFTG